MIKMLIHEGQNYFEIVEFSPFFGDKIYKAGCPICTIGENGNYGFLNTELLNEAIIKLPFYVKILLRLQKILKRGKKNE